MTKDEFIYGLNLCGYMVLDGKIFYEEKELIKCFEDLGVIKNAKGGLKVPAQPTIPPMPKPYKAESE